VQVVTAFFPCRVVNQFPCRIPEPEERPSIVRF
jgi:hypothetical protein